MAIDDEIPCLSGWLIELGPKNDVDRAPNLSIFNYCAP